MANVPPEPLIPATEWDAGKAAEVTRGMHALYDQQADYDEAILGAQGRHGASRGFQEEALGNYRDMVEGKGPSVAQKQAQMQAEQNIAAQMGMAAQGRGGNLAAAQRQASSIGAGMQAQTNMQSAMLRAQEQEAAMGGFAGMANQMSAQDQQEKLAYEQLLAQNQLGFAGTEVDWRLGRGALILQAEQQKHQRNMAWANWASGLVGGIMGGASSMNSDERVKENIEQYGPEERAGIASIGDQEAIMLAEKAVEQGGGGKGIARTQADVADALANIGSYTYDYKPGAGPPGQRVGPMAQDLRAMPATQGVVFDTPEGLAVDTGGLAALGVAASADQERRLQALEQQARGLKTDQRDDLMGRSGGMIGRDMAGTTSNSEASGKKLGSGIASLFSMGAGGGGGGMMGGGGGGGMGNFANFANFASMFGGR